MKRFSKNNSIPKLSNGYVQNGSVKNGILKTSNQRKVSDADSEADSFASNRKAKLIIDQNPLDTSPNSGQIRGPQLKCYADKMREIVAIFGWLTPLYLVCVLSQCA